MSLTLIQATPKELAELINQGVKSQLDDFKKELTSQNTNDDLLTRKEAFEFLKIDSSTLWNWTNKGKVKSYGIANRRYYKRSELLESLKLLKK